MIGLRSGHVSRANVTLTLGVEAELSATLDPEPAIAGACRSAIMKRMNETLPKHIHLSGICGTAMASLAGLLREKGCRVTGSDAAAYPPMSDQLRAMGIPVAQPYAAENLDNKPDLVVIGNALSRGNPEIERVLEPERIPFTSMAAVLHDEFLKGRESLVVAGTHGKTTTTSMLAWIYQIAACENPEFEPSFLIGGVAENFGTSYQLRPTRTFLLEGDEYDTAFFDKGPKFLHYFPDGVILTSVEFDHADIYADLEAVKVAFKRLVNLVPRRGVIVAYDGSNNVTECVAMAFCRVERYGFSESSDWRIVNFRHEDGLSKWDVLHVGKLWAALEMQVAGEHNALNATAAAALAAEPRRSGRGDSGGFGQLFEREAAAGSARGGRRRDDHRRLCAPPDGHSRDPARAAASLWKGKALGRSGAAFEHLAAQCFSAGADRKPGSG